MKLYCETNWGVTIFFILILQCVSDIFHTMVMEIEKANGNLQEKQNNCNIS